MTFPSTRVPVSLELGLVSEQPNSRSMATTAMQSIKEAKEQCLTSLHTGHGEGSHEEFLEYVLTACKDAAKHFRNDVACFRVPCNLDHVRIIHQLKEGGFMVECAHGGLLKVGWVDPERELLDREQNEQDPTNVARVEELDRRLCDAVRDMGLAHTSVELHPNVPRSAIAFFAWL